MAKDVNIHVKAENVEATKAQLEALGFTISEVGAKTSRAGGWMKEAFSALVGPLGVAGIVATVVAGVRKIIAAFDDMKKAASDAVHELANQQRAATSFFEAMDAYSGPQKKAALMQARGLQAATGIPQEAAMQILEAQKRTFGAVSPQASEQFAAYWAMHAQGATTDLIRWMGESKITTPERQGQIMRMISAVSKQTNLKDEELIQALVSRGERFRYLGWTPEEAITNVGKALGGLSPAEASRAMRGLFESLEISAETAKKLGVPKGVRASEQERLEWIRTKAATLPPERRAIFMREAFGPSAPYVTKMFFAPAPPITPLTAEEEARRFAEYQKTEEAQLEMAKGKGVYLEGAVTPEITRQVIIREHGKAYLKYLQIADPIRYRAIKTLGLSETAEQEIAARELWQTNQLRKKPPIGTFGKIGPHPSYFNWWETTLEEERIPALERAAQTINIYNIGTVYTPRVGSDERGPRAPVNLK